MVAVPRVRKFVGCVDLKAASLVIAVIRLVISLIALVGLLNMFVIMVSAYPSDDDTSKYDDEDGEMPYGLVVLLIFIFGVVIVLLVANLLVTYWFIRGLLSYKPQK